MQSQRASTFAIRTLAAVIIVLIVVLAAAATLAAQRYGRYLTGLWVGNPVFLTKAELKDFQLFIAPRERGRRQGYLIITGSDGEFVSNQAVEIRERPRGWSALCAAFRTERDAYVEPAFEIEYDSVVLSGESPPMPASMKMTLSILGGTLTLYDGEKVYAFLEKDFDASAAATAAYGAA